MSGSSFIEVTVSHSALAFIYRLFTPTIEISGKKERRRWGVHLFMLPPGYYPVSVSYPWLFAPECGKNSVWISLEGGQTRKVKYRAGLLRYLPGKISVDLAAQAGFNAILDRASRALSKSTQRVLARSL